MFTPAQILRNARICIVLGVTLANCVLALAMSRPWNYYWLFAVCCWAALNLYWWFAARNTNPGITKWGWLLWSISVAEFLLYSLPLSSVPILGQRLVPRFTAMEILGAVLCAFGGGFAIWARHILAASWNNIPTLPKSHALVQTGPYAIIRHPIYFGFMTSAVGMILVLGEVRALVLFLDIVVFFRKMKPEESILRTSYPTAYPEYERRVKRLLPFIW